jgi:hypothetical protein
MIIPVEVTVSLHRRELRFIKVTPFALHLGGHVKLHRRRQWDPLSSDHADYERRERLGR